MVSTINITNGMEPNITVGEDRNIFFCGAWIAGLKISDRLVKCIASEFSKKPSKRCSLALNSKGLNLQTFPSFTHLDSSVSGDTKPGKLQHIPFPALREFSINPHNQFCLMVTFVDAKNEFSICVFSCDNPRILREIAAKYKELRNRQILESPSLSPGANGSAAIVSGNWTLREQDSTSNSKTAPSTQENSANGISGDLNTPTAQILKQHSQNGGGVFTTINIQKIPTQKSQDDGAKGSEQIASDNNNSSNRNSVVIDGKDPVCEIYRELVNSGTSGAVKTFNVAIQVNSSELTSENDSVSTSGSIRSVSWSDDLEDSAFGTNGESSQSSSISSERYHTERNRVVYGERNGQEKDTDLSPVSQVANGHGLTYTSISIETLRDVGAQTEPPIPTPQRGRFTKKPLKPSLSNQYKEKVAAVRKKSGSGNTSTARPTTAQSISPVSTVSGSPSTGQGEMLRASSGKTSLVKVAPNTSMAAVPQQQQPLPSNTATPTHFNKSISAISRPIEYKEKVAAVRKKSGSGNTSTAQPTTAQNISLVSTVSGSPSTGQGEWLRANPGKISLVKVAPNTSMAAVPQQQQPLPSNTASPNLFNRSISTISRPIETVYSQRLPGHTPHSYDQGDFVEQDKQKRKPAAGPKRVVVLPNRQAVVLSPISPPGRGSSHQPPQFFQHPFLGAGLRLRKTSTSSYNSVTSFSGDRGDSRSSSLRMRAQSGQQQTARPISYPPPTR